MEEMRFFFDKTNYESIREAAFFRARERRYQYGTWWDSQTISHRSKHHAFNAFLKKSRGRSSSMQGVPESLKGNCRDCGQRWATAVPSDSSDDKDDEDDYYERSDDEDDYYESSDDEFDHYRYRYR